MAKELPLRSEVNAADTWNLKDLFATNEEWHASVDSLMADAEALASYEGRTTESAQTLFDALEAESALMLKASRAGTYARQLYDQDTSDTEHQAMDGKFSSIIAQVRGRIAFIAPEILKLDPAVLDGYYKELPALEFYRKAIDEVQRCRPHSLSTELEKVMAMTSEVCDVPSDVFSVLNNADIRFPEITDADGSKIRLTHGRLVPLLESADPNVRREAFTQYYSSYKQFLNTYAALYSGQVKQLIFNAKMRNYESTLEASVGANNVPSTVYKNLVATVNKNLDKLHRYVRIRKQCLGVDELHMYDIYTPMIAGVAREIPYEEAKEMVLAGMAPLGEDYVAAVKKGFEERWVDVYENQGKRSGAYSTGCYGVHPYVLLNYHGSLDNVFTLTHEMGHSMHTYYSTEAQPFIYSRYKIFVAEVASTCNEILLVEHLLKNTTDKKERAYLLNHYLDTFKGTLFRQTQFAEYEMLTNEMAERGESLNAASLSDLYLKINEKYYGPDMISDPEIAWEWARIPHFYYDFYVYQYATCISAAVTIANRILTEGEPVVKKYRQFLSGGCSDSPVNLLRLVDIDMESCEPIQTALDVMDRVMDELEELLKED